MKPRAARTVLGIEHEEIDSGATKIIGDGQARLTSSDHDDIMIAFIHAERFCGMVAIVERSVVGSIVLPAAFLSE
jgi:hypothetical protein